MEINQYIIDAFTDKPFTGNPAAVVVLDSFLDESIMKNMAMENNFSETAFVVKEGDKYHIRWFTPTMEVLLCGHATLSSTFVLGEFYDKEKKDFEFTSLSGDLKATKTGNEVTLNFPIYESTEVENKKEYEEILGIKPTKAYTSVDYIFMFEKEEDVINFKPDINKIKQLKDLEGVIITAPSKQYDFVSRGFWPNEGIDEDPVTGAAHCSLFPLWGKILNKTVMHAKQVSHRGGEIKGELKENRVYLTGKARLYSKASIYL